MKPLRPYQNDCAEAVALEFNTVNSTLIVLPTGTGKTRVAVEVIRRALPARSIFVAHRQELVWQARDAIDELITGQNCEIEMAEHYARHHRTADGTVIAMVQSLNSKNGDGRRMDRFHPDDFGLLVIDEFHHSVAASYRAVINHFRRNPNLKVLGLTATPDRADEEALAQVCDSVAYDYEIIDAINDGWLVPVEQMLVPISGLDFSHIKTTAGDLNQSQLADVMEAESSIQGVVQPVLELMFRLNRRTLDTVPVERWGPFLRQHNPHPRRTLVFTVSVKQAETLCHIFNRVDPNLANWVCGFTPTESRQQLLRQYEAGAFPVMVNCNCFSEGFDSPGVEVIVQARPTKSRSLYAQQVGRATRPLAGVVDGLDDAEARRAAIADSRKPCCTVLDFAGNSGRHKLVTTADILGGKITETAMNSTLWMLQRLEKPINIIEAVKQEQKKEQEKIERELREVEAKKARVVARVKYTTRFVNPFDTLQIMPWRLREWDRGKHLSYKQKDLLLKQGINPEDLNYAEGRQLVAEIVKRFKGNLCSMKQAAVLKRFHLPVNVSRTQASTWLNELAGNRWRPTDNLRKLQTLPPITEYTA